MPIKKTSTLLNANLHRSPGTLRDPRAHRAAVDEPLFTPSRNEDVEFFEVCASPQLQFLKLNPPAHARTRHCGRSFWQMFTTVHPALRAIGCDCQPLLPLTTLQLPRRILQKFDFILTIEENGASLDKHRWHEGLQVVTWETAFIHGISIPRNIVHQLPGRPPQS
jgi:hypothetical protein